MVNKTVLVIDCIPGRIRPNDILKYVISGTGLKENDFTVESALFGAWNFSINPEKKSLFEKNKDQIIERLVFSYRNGSIRYAEYYFD